MSNADVLFLEKFQTLNSTLIKGIWLGNLPLELVLLTRQTKDRQNWEKKKNLNERKPSKPRVD